MRLDVRLESGLGAPGRAWGAPLLVVLTWLAVVAPALRPDHTLFFRDHALIFSRLLARVQASLARGAWPLWDPLVGGGEPLAAYPAAMTLSPLSVLHLLPLDSFVIHDLFVAGLLLLAGLSAERLAKSLGLSVPARAVVGVAFMGAGPVVSMNSLLPALQCLALSPLVLAAGLEAARTPTPGRAAAFGVIVAAHVSISDPAIVFSTMLLGGLLVLSALAADPRWRAERRPILRRLAALGFAVILAVTLSAAAWIPLFDLLAGTSRGAGFDEAVTARFSLSPLRLFELVLPGLGGDPLSMFELFSERGGSGYLPSIYLGIVPLFLAVLGVRARGAGPWCVGALVLGLLALGSWTPLHRLALAAVPGLSTSRFPVKFLGGVALSVAVFAGLGLDRLLAGLRAPSRPLRFTWLAALAVAAPFCASFVLVEVFVGTRSEGATLAEARARVEAAQAHAGLILALLALTLVSLRFLTPSRVARALVGLSVIDLGLAATSALPTIEVGQVRTAPLREAVLRERPRPLLFVYDQYFEAGASAARDRRELTRAFVRRVSPHFAGRDGVRYLFDQDLNGTRSPEWRRVWSRLFDVPEGARLNLLRRTGHTHLIVEANVAETPDLELVARDEILAGRPTSLFRLKRARPLPAFVAEGRALDGEEAVLERAFVETSTGAVLAERSSIERLGLPERAPQAASARFTGVEETGRSWVVEVEVPSDGAVILPISFHPDWVARIDGEEVPLVRVELLQSAVPVKAGRARIELEYRPASFDLGVAVSSLGLALLGLALWVDRRGSRRATASA